MHSFTAQQSSIIGQLAALLGIRPTQVSVVGVAAEDSGLRRRRRAQRRLLQLAGVGPQMLF
jgi:hypothetical protein